MDYAAGDIVQIIDRADPWYPCLLVVTEPKSWGVQGCVMMPSSNEQQDSVGQAYRRLPFDKIKKVGLAEIIPGD